jgi:mannan endo-1,6-alpha-mannosidase
MLGSLVDYWYYTGDDSFVDLTKQGLLFQVGPEEDYMTPNQTLTEGNDDQGFWGLAVMSAAEYNFPQPKPDEPQWLALAQAVFNTQAARWDPENCNGGLRWQIFQWNQGWDYKNSISQGCFFALAARLALYTGNSSYAEWAVRSWEWTTGANFIDNETWAVYDGAHTGTNCTDIVPYQWSYNAGVFILGAAAMYNLTEDGAWKDRLDGLLGGARVFFMQDTKIMTEAACESVDRCNTDQQSFKAYLSRWYAAVTKWAPYTHDDIMSLLRPSAVAAAKQCTGGDNGRMCGLKWYEDEWDGTTGVGQQMAAMEVTLACMIDERRSPYTAHNGGLSLGNPGAGGSDADQTKPVVEFSPITKGDKAGAVFLTLALLGALVGGMVWLFLDETSDKSAVEQIKDLQSAATAASKAAWASQGGARGAVTAALRKRDIPEVDEKRPDLTTFATSSIRPSSSEQPIFAEAFLPPTPAAVAGPSGNRCSGRLSNMPLGWPHNPSLRRQSMNEKYERPKPKKRTPSQEYFTAEDDDPRPATAPEVSEDTRPSSAEEPLSITSRAL